MKRRVAVPSAESPSSGGSARREAIRRELEMISRASRQLDRAGRRLARRKDLPGRETVLVRIARGILQLDEISQDLLDIEPQLAEDWRIPAVDVEPAVLAKMVEDTEDAAVRDELLRQLWSIAPSSVRSRMRRAVTDSRKSGILLRWCRGVTGSVVRLDLVDKLLGSPRLWIRYQAAMIVQKRFGDVIWDRGSNDLDVKSVKSLRRRLRAEQNSGRARTR